MTRSFATAALVALLAACATASGTGDRFPVREVNDGPGLRGRLFWLDNHRVLFDGSSGGRYWEKPGGFKQPIDLLTVWDTATGERRKYGEIAGSSLCFDDGYVSYWRWLKQDGQYVDEREWVAGKLFEEKPVGVGRSAGLSTLTCRPINETPALPAWAEGREVKRLRPEHGFLDFGPRGPQPWRVTDRIRLHRPNDPTGVELPIRRGDVWGVEYLPGKQVYLLYGDYLVEDARHPNGGWGLGPWPKDKPKPVWWVYSDGRTEQMMLPPGAWEARLEMPTARGVVGYKRGSGALEALERGLYLFDGRQLVRLLDGHVMTASVSPDGCRVAVWHDPQPFGEVQPRTRFPSLKVVELCGGT